MKINVVYVQLSGFFWESAFWSCACQHAYREHNGSTEKKVLRAEGGEEEGATTILSSWTEQTPWGDENGSKSVIENYSSVNEPWFTVQSTEWAKWADAGGTNSSEVPKKLWSKLYFMNPWTKQSDDGSGQLGMSWTTPVAYCGNYSCFDGVVSADLTLDRVDTILEQQWISMQKDLMLLSSYELSQNTSSIFIVNRASPRFPEQEGMLIGSSSDGAGESSAQSGELTLAKDSDHEVVKLASRAVLEKYGTDSWANVVVNPDETEPFYFSKSKLESTGELDSKACTPLEALKSQESPWAPDCFQVALKTMMLDEKLEWLMVVVMPSAAFRKQSQNITDIEQRAEEAMNTANERTEKLMTWALVLGGVIAAVCLSMTVGFSFLVLRPLDQLGFLMKRLGQLDFAHNSQEFRKLHKGAMGFVTEVNDLQDGFCRLSKSIEIFARFVPETVVRGLVRGEDRKLRPYVDPRNVTTMFSDIRDFTTISEKLSQDDLCFVLYLYLETMIEIIEEEKGVVAEVLGDGLLAFWNTPDDVANHQAKACNAALRQQEALRILNEKLASLGLPQLAIRIGIHTGQVLTGNLGSETKMKFGCMGDPVNLASRLEGLCKMYGVGVMISGTTYEALPSASGFACRRLDLVQVKGKKEPTMIYELMGRDILTRKTDKTDSFDEFERSLGVEPFRKAQAANYERALQAYQEARFQEAVQIAGELPESDLAGQKLLERAKRYVGWRGTSLSKEELANWTGVVGMTDK
jgi:class 3 adenylate cyclase